MKSSSCINEEILNFILQKVKKANKTPQEKKVLSACADSLSEFKCTAPVVRGEKGEYYQLLYDCWVGGTPRGTR